MSQIVITSDTAKIDFSEYVQDSLNMQFAYADSKGKLFDVTGWEVDIEIRAKAKDLNPILALSSNNGQIDLSGEEFNIVALLSDVQTLALGKGDFVYFVRTKDTQGFVNTLAVGKIKLRSR